MVRFCVLMESGVSSLVKYSQRYIYVKDCQSALDQIKRTSGIGCIIVLLLLKTVKLFTRQALK